MRVLAAAEGPLGYHIARQIRQLGHRLTLIVRSRADAEEMARRLDVTVAHGDATRPDLLAELDADRADLLLALSARDQDNLLTCQIARARFDVPRTIALVNDPDNRALFEALGVGPVISPAEIAAAAVGQHSAFEGLVARLPLRAGRLDLLELRLPEGAPCVGRTLAELRLPVGSLVAAVIRQDEVLVPNGATALAAGDLLLLVCRTASERDALRGLVGP